MRITPAFVVISLLGTAAACGSSVSSEDDDGSGGGATGVASTAATATASSTGAGPTSTATSTATAATAGGSNPSGPGAGGSGEGGVSTGDGGADVGTGASGPGGPGAGGSSSTGTPVLCGEVECADDEQCCGSQQGLQCIGANEDCQGATITCQNASNCDNGQICCLTGDFQNAEAACADECEDTQIGPIQLCETAEECVEDVPCMEIFGGFKACSNGFPGGPPGP